MSQWNELMKRCCCRSRLWPWQWKSVSVHGVSHVSCYFEVFASQAHAEATAVVQAVSVPTELADDEPKLFDTDRNRR
jgi:hypothetical protein